MSLDPNTPVIIGVGQHNQRTDEGAPPLEPADMMLTAARLALSDTGTELDPSEIDTVRTVGILSWRYADAGNLVAERLGVGHPVSSGVTAWSGSSPQLLVNRTARDIQSGDVSLALLTGAESWRTRNFMRRSGEKPDWSVQPDGTPEAPLVDDNIPMMNDAEAAAGIVMPIQVYPMLEHAHRAHLGRTVEEHMPKVADMWAGFSEVASRNPHAWIREPMSAEEILTPSDSNRQVSHPYTKAMNSNDLVEQSAALLLCSVEVAERLGVPREKWVFPLSGSDVTEYKFLSERETLGMAPPVAIGGKAAMDLAGVTPDDIDHVDLYSCFPVAVQIGAAELGFPLDRQLTQTGGLRFAGGPWNNYVMHAIATMVEVLRADPGSTGFTWANGGFMTKHSFGVYGTEPGPDGFRYANPQDEVDALPGRELAADHVGPATVETWTVMYGRDGAPETALFAVLDAEGRRAWATSTDNAVLAAATTEEMIGRAVSRHEDGSLTLA